MNEQEMYIRVGELATAIGYPMPSIEWTEARGRVVAFDEQRVAGPALRLRPEAAHWCSSLRDVLIAEILLSARFGAYRQQRQFKIWVTAVTAAVGFVLGLSVGGSAIWWWIPAAWVLFTAFSAVYSRRLARKVDARMVEILGPETVLEGLEQRQFRLGPANFLRWLWSGAGTLPSERIGWLRAAYPGIASVAD
ncbi:hypothetical protein ACWF0M_31485 [Kribbella sp. NPDC055110]